MRFLKPVNNNNLNILIITYNDYPFYDGLSTRIANLAKCYSNAGNRVTIIAPNVDYNQSNEEVVEKSVRIIRVNIPFISLFRSNRILLRNYVTILQTLTTFYIYLRYLRNETIDIVQAQQVYAIPPALIVKFMTRAKVVVDDITTVSDILRDTGHRLLSRIFTYAEKLLFFFCDDFIYTSSVCRDYCLKRGREPKIFGPNGVDCQQFSPLEATKERKVIFFNCSTYYHQNLNAIKLFHEICLDLIGRTKTPFVFNLVCGPLNGLPQTFLAKLKSKNEFFLIEASVKDIAQKIMQSDITLLPYATGDHLTGGVRLKALEYMACGKVVVSTHEGIEGISGLVSEKHLIVKDTKEDIVLALADILTNPDRYRNLCQSARDFAEEHYDWRKIGRGIIIEFCRLLR